MGSLTVVVVMGHDHSLTALLLPGLPFTLPGLPFGETPYLLYLVWVGLLLNPPSIRPIRPSYYLSYYLSWALTFGSGFIGLW